MELHVQGAAPEPIRFGSLCRQEPAQERELITANVLGRERRTEGFDRAPVLEDLPQLIGLPPQPLRCHLDYGRAHERTAQLAPADLDVALVLEPVQAFADCRPVDAKAEAELALGRKALTRQVFVQPDRGQEEPGDLVAKPKAAGSLG